MKIISLTAENIKKLVAVHIEPNGNLVQITGKNGQGKTSVLDSIWWALTGTSNVQPTPIRNGEERGTIKLDLGEMQVTRTFIAQEDGSFTSSIKVENKDGARFQSPQALLDGLLGKLSLDPLAFVRMAPKQQYDTMKKFVPGVDFEKIERDNYQDFEKRRDINRRAKEARSGADQMPPLVDEDFCPTRIDTSALVQKIADAGEHNRLREERIGKREAFKNASINKARTAFELRTKAQAILSEAQQLEEQVRVEKEKYEKAEPLPEPIDVREIQAQINDANVENAKTAQIEKKIELMGLAVKLEKEANELTVAIEKRDEAKRNAIQSSSLPVEGIGFGKDGITLNGVPFEQASDAEQLRASVAIAMAAEPKLRVIRVRDGSLLDEDALKVLEEVAAQKDFQVWIERVDGSGKVGFVLEDGHIKEAEGIIASNEEPVAVPDHSVHTGAVS